jgi:hypothetical protein
MGQRRLKWGDVEKYLLKRGYEIRPSGGDKVIVAPTDGNPDRLRQQLRIGHTSCGNSKTEILKVYESKLRNLFGIDTNEIGD